MIQVPLYEEFEQKINDLNERVDNLNPDESGKDYVTEDELEAALGELNIPDLNEYAKLTDLNNYVTNDELTDAINNIPEVDLSGYVTSNQLEDYITSNELNEKISEINIPDTSQFITSDQVDSKLENYTPDLSDYSTTSQIDSKDTIVLNSSKEYTDQKISEIDLSNYQLTTVADGKYAFKTDLDGYITTLQLTNTVNPISQAVDSVSSLLNLTIGNLGDTDQRVNDLTNTVNNNVTEYGVYHKTGDTIYRTGVDVPFVQNQIGNEQDLIDRDELKAHSDSDLTNISKLFDLFTQQINDLKIQILDLQARISNKTLDTSNTVNIESQAQGDGYTVNNSLGGVVTFTSPLVILTGVGTLYINGVQRWTNVGITVAIGSSGDTLEVQDGDVITCSGMSSITFTPYISA